MKKTSILISFSIAVGSLFSCAQTQSQASIVDCSTVKPADTATVYMTTEISPEALQKIYHALGREATGKVAVKISTGEPGGHNFLNPGLIAPFVKEVNGTIVECNTAYQGKRYTAEDHYKAAEDHGFTAIAHDDIIDAEGENKLPL